MMKTVMVPPLVQSTTARSVADKRAKKLLLSNRLTDVFLFSGLCADWVTVLLWPLLTPLFTLLTKLDKTNC